MRTAIFLSIREKATRLPKKVLREVCGQTMAEHLIDRLKTAREPDGILLCTSTHPDDTVLCDIALKKGIHYFRGSEDDKLQRYLDAAAAFGVEFFCVVDGDDIFCSAEAIDRAVRAWRQTGADYITAADLPVGATPFGVKTAALQRVVETKAESDTEVWGGYFTQSDEFEVLELPVEDERLRHPEYRMTLDYPEDLEFFETVFKALHKPPKVFSFAELMDYLNAHPEVVKINAQAAARYEAHLRQSAPVRRKDVPGTAAAAARADRRNTTALVVGLGSMGKRRIRCLKALGVGRVVGFDPREDRRNEAAEKYGIETVETVKAGFVAKPNMAIISTPPDTHLPHAREACRRGVHFFTEAGVETEGFDKLQADAEKKGIVAAPSCTMRFFRGPKIIKEVLASGAIGRPCSFTHMVSNYLPDWHPWEDIRDFYVSKANTGACREIVPFELAWLTDVFGLFEEVKALRGRLGELGVDIDDVYHLLLAAPSRQIIGHLTMDVLGRPYVRRLHVIATGGQLIWNAGERIVRWYTMDDDQWHQRPEGAATVEAGYTSPEEPYIEELGAFLAAAEGGPAFPYTYADDAAVLNLLYRAEADSKKK